MSNEINTKDVISSRVIKTSVVRLVTNNRYKPCVIKAIDKLVLLNSKIAVLLEIRRKSPLTYVLDIISAVSGIDFRWWD